jgi:hypothetical protein
MLQRLGRAFPLVDSDRVQSGRFEFLIKGRIFSQSIGECVEFGAKFDIGPVKDLLGEPEIDIGERLPVVKRNIIDVPAELIDELADIALEIFALGIFLFKFGNDAAKYLTKICLRARGCCWDRAH